MEQNQEYSENSFWDKMKDYAKAAGYEVVEKALELYYVLQEKNTPTWAKTVIISALAYFIMPIDAIPDMIPVAGYTDDLGALAAAYKTTKEYVTDDIKAKAEQKLKEWFGN